MEIWERGYNKVDGKKREWSKTKVSFFYRSVWKYFEYPAAIELSRERVAIETEVRFHRLIW